MYFNFVKYFHIHYLTDSYSNLVNIDFGEPAGQRDCDLPKPSSLPKWAAGVTLCKTNPAWKLGHWTPNLVPLTILHWTKQDKTTYKMTYGIRRVFPPKYQPGQKGNLLTSARCCPRTCAPAQGGWRGANGAVQPQHHRAAELWGKVQEVELTLTLLVGQGMTGRGWGTEKPGSEGKCGGWLGGWRSAGVVVRADIGDILCTGRTSRKPFSSSEWAQR